MNQVVPPQVPPAPSARTGPIEPVAPDRPDPVADPDWLAAQASRTGIPSRVLEAYVAADLRLQSEQPDCRLSWATLAGIGWVESHHGTINGNAIGTDGRPALGPIVGVALDGVGVAALPDTDGGAWDGDADWDRAVGPMQIIPTTWATWAADGDGDGVTDPQDIDDAAYVAGRYLCAAATPLSDPEPWRTAVRAYNDSDVYVVEVVTATNAYAARSRA